MKRAFTLIELLVVIAIIAILAAILFPVFAQAKVAAKKTAGISNQKQISLGVLMYLADNEDTYPRRGGCEINTSINPKLNDGTLRCGGAAGFSHSMTWQTWQKYVMPYVKNVQLFEHPLRTKSQTDWDTNGQLLNAFVINLGIFGSSVTGFESIPWTGGTQTALRDPASMMTLMEMPNTYAAPFAVQNGGPSIQTVYPMAVREYWRAIFLKNNGGCNTTEEPDPVGATAAQGVVCGFGDGSAKFLNVKAFLGKTPTIAQYLPGVSLPGPMGSNCRNARSSFNYSGGPATPVTNIDYPLWGLGQ